ncbi:MAG: hypothetical protein LBN21_10595 [Treponema sp.]|jgi:hypothetical protein|nr:hypothetical protein [Treponema sp.]
MASEKKPSIYSDRSTIGSTDELDEYGVWVKSEPQDLSSAAAEGQDSVESSMPDDIDDLPDFDAGFGDEPLEIPDFDLPAESAGTDDAEPVADITDDDITAIDDSIGILDDITASDDSADGEVLDFDDLSIPEDSAGEDDDVSEAESGFTEVSMTEFLGDDGENPLADFDAPDLESAGSVTAAPEKSAPQEDLSTRLLMKIADELSSIRSELSTLKKEFSTIRGEGPAEEKPGAQKSGFFDEEDDEKISLTGDELDNILNTADFTEEAGADATEDLSDDFSALVLDDSPAPVQPENDIADQEDIIPLETEITAEEPVPVLDEQLDLVELGGENSLEDQLSGTDEFDINLELSPVDEEIDELTIDETKDSEELQLLRTEGAEPLTPAPEDTSYLEEDPLASEPVPDEDISFEEPAIAEPVPEETLTEEISFEEPAIEETFTEEISLEEPVSEEAELEISEEPLSEEAELEISEEPDAETADDEISIDLSETETLDDFTLDDTTLDLSDAVIDEPDLSLDITENPVEEPSLEDISINLDEDEPELPVPGDVEDSTAESEDDSFAQVIPEGFVVEADDSPVPFDDDLEEEFTESLAAPESQDTAAEILTEDEEADEETAADEALDIPSGIKQELKTVLSYMDQLLESLPDDKIEEFAKSEYFDTYKKLFKELGLV